MQLLLSVLVRNLAISSSDSCELFRDIFEFEFTGKEVAISYWGNMPFCRLCILPTSSKTGERQLDMKNSAGANRRNNSQHYWPNNVGSCCVRVGSGVQTDATTDRCIVERTQPIRL